MTERTLDEILYHMPTVERLASDAWTRDFAASIRRQSRRRDWTPSPKQLGIMRRLVSDLFVHAGDEEGGFDVIVAD